MCSLILLPADAWGLISHSILNKFAPRHSIFRQELHKYQQATAKVLLDRSRFICLSLPSSSL